MKRSQIFQLVALILVGVGLFALFGSFPDSTHTETFTVPTGNYYYRFQFELLMGSDIHGNFTVTSGAPVRVMIFTEPEFNKYAATGGGVPIFMTSGSSGTFSARESGMTRIYLVFEHLSALSSTDMQMTYTMSGIAVTYLVAGMILVAAGAVMALLSTRFRKMEIKSAPTSPVATDVTLFKDQTPPGPRR